MNGFFCQRPVITVHPLWTISLTCVRWRTHHYNDNWLNWLRQNFVSFLNLIDDINNNIEKYFCSNFYLRFYQLIRNCSTDGFIALRKTTACSNIVQFRNLDLVSHRTLTVRITELYCLKNKFSVGGNHQSFLTFDNTFYRMSQPSNQMTPNDLMYAKSLAEHSNQLSLNMGEESSRFVDFGISNRWVSVATMFFLQRTTVHGINKNEKSIDQQRGDQWSIFAGAVPQGTLRWNFFLFSFNLTVNHFCDFHSSRTLS